MGSFAAIRSSKLSMPSGVGPSGVDDAFEPRVRRSDGGRHGAEEVIDDEHVGIDLGERVDGLRYRPADVDRDDDADGPWRAGEELVVAVGVEGEDRRPLAVLDAEGPQAAASRAMRSTDSALVLVRPLQMVAIWCGRCWTDRCRSCVRYMPGERGRGGVSNNRFGCAVALLLWGRPAARDTQRQPTRRSRNRCVSASVEYR